MSKINVADIAVGDIFSESAHYTCESVEATTVKLKHLESGKTVSLNHQYVTDLLSTADQYEKEVFVNKEDSAKSGKGIRTIFEEIGTSQVFTVTFTKQEAAKTQKAIKDEKEAIVAKAAAKLANKGRMSNALITGIIMDVIDNPVIPTIPGEVRTLRGFKQEFTSRDGRYNCVDMDITSGNNVRPVNINTISSLVIDGVKYTVK